MSKDVPISDETRAEIESIVRGLSVSHEYCEFLVRWIAFNRAYNELEDDKEEWQRVVKVGERLKDHWTEEMQRLATDLVRLECVGGNKVPDHRLLQPCDWIKSATKYLREQLPLLHNDQHRFCVDPYCRPEKQAVCSRSGAPEWKNCEMAALLRIVYQVRCNLVHGDKRLHAQDVQTNRDHDLIRLSTCVLDRVLGFLLTDNL